MLKRILLLAVPLFAIAAIFIFSRGTETDSYSIRAEVIEAPHTDLVPTEALHFKLERSGTENSRMVEPDSLIIESSSPGQVISGQVIDGFNNPITGASCQVFETDAMNELQGLVFRASRKLEAMGETHSDGNGLFQIQVPHGQWTLHVTAEGFSAWSEAGLRAGDFRRIQLAPARSAKLALCDLLGAPVAGASVRLVKGEWGDPGIAKYSTLSNESGEATIEPIPAGLWYAQITHGDFVPLRLALPEGSAALEPIKVEMKRGVHVIGCVTTQGSVRAPAGTRVTFHTSDGLNSSHSVACDANGNYRSLTAFEDYDALEVSVLAPGFGELRRDVYIGELSGGDQREDFLLETTERFAIGRVVDPEGAPLEGVEVYVLPLKALPPETLVPIPEVGLPDLMAYQPSKTRRGLRRAADRTDAQGLFRIDGLDPRTNYQILLAYPGYSNAALWLETAQAGATTDFGVTTLQPAARVWGFVRQADGTPVEGIRVYTVRWNTNHVEQGGVFQTRRPSAEMAGLEAITGPSGLFSISSLPAGEFRLASEYSDLTQSFTIASGEELGPVELIATPEHDSIPVRFEVVDTLGTPVPRAHASMKLAPSTAEGVETPDPAISSWVWDMGDDSGILSLGARSAGIYDVEIKDMQGLLSRVSLQVEVGVAGVERRIVLPASPKPSAPLGGRVLSSDGRPLSGFEVTLVPNTGSTSCGCLELKTQTDASGGFSYGHFMSGDHRITVTDPSGRLAPVHYYPAQAGIPIEITFNDD